MEFLCCRIEVTSRLPMPTKILRPKYELWQIHLALRLSPVCLYLLIALIVFMSCEITNCQRLAYGSTAKSTFQLAAAACSFPCSWLSLAAELCLACLACHGVWLLGALLVLLACLYALCSVCRCSVDRLVDVCDMLYVCKTVCFYFILKLLWKLKNKFSDWNSSKSDPTLASWL